MWHLKKNEEKLLLIAAQTIFLQSLLVFSTVFPKNFVIFFTNTNSWKLSKLCAMQTMPQHNAIHRIIYCPQPPFHHPLPFPLLINCHALPQERIQLLVCQVRQFLSAFIQTSFIAIVVGVAIVCVSCSKNWQKPGPFVNEWVSRECGLWMNVYIHREAERGSEGRKGARGSAINSKSQRIQN